MRVLILLALFVASCSAFFLKGRRVYGYDDSGEGIYGGRGLFNFGKKGIFGGKGGGRGYRGKGYGGRVKTCNLGYGSGYGHTKDRYQSGYKGNKGYGAQYGAQHGGQYGAQHGGQYGAQYGGQYGAQYGGQYGGHGNYGAHGNYGGYNNNKVQSGYGGYGGVGGSWIPIGKVSHGYLITPHSGEYKGNVGVGGFKVTSGPGISTSFHGSGISSYSGLNTGGGSSSHGFKGSSYNRPIAFTNTNTGNLGTNSYKKPNPFGNNIGPFSTNIGIAPLKLDSHEKSTHTTGNFNSFTSGYGGPSGKIQLSNIQSSFEKK